MTESLQKEQLSFAYVHAIAARAGYKCDYSRVDDDSEDMRIGATGYIHKKAVMRSPQLSVQLKATASDEIGGDSLSFPLPVRNYDHLRLESALPRLLIVLFLPEDPALWIEQDEERMISRRCAYWLSLAG